MMSTSCGGPRDQYRVDCLSVQQGTLHGAEWAASPNNRHARTWIPIAAAMEHEPERCVWMPAHCTTEQIGKKRLGNGAALTATDHAANALVDELAKRAAAQDRLSDWARRGVVNLASRLESVAKWLGQATVLANEWPAPGSMEADTTSCAKKIRDAEAVPRVAPRPRATAPVGPRTRSSAAQFPLKMTPKRRSTLGSTAARATKPRAPQRQRGCLREAVDAELGAQASLGPDCH